MADTSTRLHAQLTQCSALSAVSDGVAGISNVRNTTLIVQYPAFVCILFGACYMLCATSVQGLLNQGTVSRTTRGRHTGTIPTQTQECSLDNRSQERIAARLWHVNQETRKRLLTS